MMRYFSLGQEGEATSDVDAITFKVLTIACNSASQLERLTVRCVLEEPKAKLPLIIKIHAEVLRLCSLF